MRTATTKEFAFWSYLTTMGYFVLTVIGLYCFRQITTWEWHHWRGPPTPHSLYFTAWWLSVEATVIPVLAIGIGVAWYEEALHPWRRGRRQTIETRSRAKDQRKLRDLALVAAENDVYDSIRENRRVSETTAALLRQAELHQ